LKGFVSESVDSHVYYLKRFWKCVHMDGSTTAFGAVLGIGKHTILEQLAQTELLHPDQTWTEKILEALGHYISFSRTRLCRRGCQRPEGFSRSWKRDS